MLFSKIVFEVCTTASAISEQGILPEQDAPVYPYITFMNSFKAICLQSNAVFMYFLFPYYIFFRNFLIDLFNKKTNLDDLLIIIREHKNSNKICGIIPSLIGFLRKATLLGAIKIESLILLKSKFSFSPKRSLRSMFALQTPILPKI